MPRFQVWRKHQLNGSFDTDFDVADFATVESDEGDCDQFDPPSDAVSVRVFRLKDGKLVLHEFRKLVQERKPLLMSDSEAVEWFTYRELPVPDLIDGRLPNATLRAESEDTDTEPFTQAHIDALVSIKAHLIHFRGGLIDFSTDRDLGDAVWFFTRFLFDVSSRDVALALAIPCQSANIWAHVATHVLTETHRLGVDRFLNQLQEQLGNQFMKKSARGISDLHWVSCSFLEQYFGSSEPISPVTSITHAEIRDMFFESCGSTGDSAVQLAAKSVSLLVQLAILAGADKLDDIPFPDIPFSDHSEVMLHSPPVLPPLEALEGAVTEKRKKGAFYRDFGWLQWKTSGLATTTPEIREKWNGLSNDERVAIARYKKFSEKIADGKSGWERIDKGLKKIEKDVESFVRKQPETSGTGKFPNVSDDVSD